MRLLVGQVANLPKTRQINNLPHIIQYHSSARQRFGDSV